jgi:hypothetical protein
LARLVPKLARLVPKLARLVPKLVRLVPKIARLVPKVVRPVIELDLFLREGVRKTCAKGWVFCSLLIYILAWSALYIRWAENFGL